MSLGGQENVDLVLVRCPECLLEEAPWSIVPGEPPSGVKLTLRRGYATITCVVPRDARDRATFNLFAEEVRRMRRELARHVGPCPRCRDTERVPA